MIVAETANLDNAKPDGTINCPDGELTTLAEYEPQTDNVELLVHAFGAADAKDCVFGINYNFTDVAFSAESPLGGINDLFSFHDALGHPVTTGSGTASLVVENRSGSDLDLAGRLIVEVR